MKIQRTDGALFHAAQPRKQESLPGTPAAAAPRAQAEISVEAQGLEQARQRMQDLSDVDMDKVQQIRQAIAEGKLTLDMETLGRAIVDLHRK
ncbi:lateral flagella anti-sigma-28 factor, LfgM [Aeromonas diversa CDC 2478-85]|uniref:Negative regulator of flagellin synthesis n=1 Tax=Aeromonas diversa CDC 2478-85 TaxID=1268237 RepID=N9VJ37_9GAMM|nr:flagellar biosynthesis anti-sigma factor FlgM [Aeromonas diversa]ENY71416.1 lateral flagella anti-sigma-28 factor, LfgM [Aeromonas diversa CDC 2478-85]